MAYITCQIDDRARSVLERRSGMQNKSIEDIAADIIESDAIRDLPGGQQNMHFAERIMTDHHPIGTYTDLQDRITRLEACLRETRRLVCRAATVGFDKETIEAIYTNNGAISNLIPVSSQERKDLGQYMDEVRYRV